MSGNSLPPKGNTRRNFLRAGTGATLAAAAYPALGAARVIDHASTLEVSSQSSSSDFELDEITIDSLQKGFESGQHTSRSVTEQYLERIAWMKAAKREISITTDVIVGFPGETEADFAKTLSLLEEVGYDAVFAFKYSPRPNTPSLKLDDAISDAEKARRLEVLMAKQREIQTICYKKYIGTTCEVMVEARNEARNQWIGRTSHNKTLNFSAPATMIPKAGSYTPVLVTGSFPNSLLGEMVV